MQPSWMIVIVPWLQNYKVPMPLLWTEGPVAFQSWREWLKFCLMLMVWGRGKLKWSEYSTSMLIGLAEFIFVSLQLQMITMRWRRNFKEHHFRASILYIYWFAHCFPFKVGVPKFSSNSEPLEMTNLNTILKPNNSLVGTTASLNLGGNIKVTLFKMFFTFLITTNL